MLPVIRVRMLESEIRSEAPPGCNNVLYLEMEVFIEKLLLQSFHSRRILLHLLRVSKCST